MDTYEAGLKTSFNAAVRGTFDVDFFYNNFKQSADSDSGSTPGADPLTDATAPVSPTTAIEQCRQIEDLRVRNRSIA